MNDLYQFLFTSVDLDVRKRCLADFVCSVYYENFSKTVGNIDSSIKMISLTDFIKEFNGKIFHGFLFGAEFHTWMMREAVADTANYQERLRILKIDDAKIIYNFKNPS